MTPNRDNTAGTPIIITAIAHERAGLVDEIIQEIEKCGCSIETVSVASLDTAVSVTLLLRVPQAAATPLRAALVGLTVRYDVKIHSDSMPEGALDRP